MDDASLSPTLTSDPVGLERPESWGLDRCASTCASRWFQPPNRTENSGGTLFSRRTGAEPGLPILLASGLWPTFLAAAEAGLERRLGASSTMASSTMASLE